MSSSASDSRHPVPRFHQLEISDPNLGEILIGSDIVIHSGTFQNIKKISWGRYSLSFRDIESFKYQKKKSCWNNVKHETICPWNLHKSLLGLCLTTQLVIIWSSFHNFSMNTKTGRLSLRHNFTESHLSWRSIELILACHCHKAWDGSDGTFKTLHTQTDTLNGTYLTFYVFL